MNRKIIVPIERLCYNPERGKYGRRGNCEGFCHHTKRHIHRKCQRKVLMALMLSGVYLNDGPQERILIHGPGRVHLNCHPNRSN